MTAATQTNQANANSIVFGQTADCSMRKCTVLGGNYMCSQGGEGLPATRIVIEDNEFVPNTTERFSVVFAPVNSLDCQIIRNRIVNQSAFPPYLLDMETNAPTDYNSNMLLAQNTIDGCGPTELQVGGLTEIARSTGNRVVDNYFRNSNGVNCGLPGTVISRNVFRMDKHATKPAINASSIYLQHVNGATMFAPDGCVIEGNVFENAGTTDGPHPIILIDSSFNKVFGNSVRDNRDLNKRGPWVIQEVQVGACLLSGGATGAPTSMAIPVTPLQIQDANAGAIITHTAQTVTIPTASTYDRVDLIVAAIATGVASVIQGPSPTVAGGTPVETAPPNCPLNSLPLAAVDVPANATSVTINNIRDYRYFAPNNNTISQDYPPVPMALGTVNLIGPLSYRAPRRKPAIVTDPYDLEVLADRPRLYLPMTEKSGPLMADLSGADNDGISAGGVLFNQQIGATERYGATFDGVSGFVQVESRSEIVYPSASPTFTIEVQLMPSTFTGVQFIIAKGLISSQQQFMLYTGNGNGTVRFFFGNQAVTSAGLISAIAPTHLVVVWDGTNVRFYFNGTADPPIAAGAPTYSPSYLVNPVLIGGADGVGTGPATNFYTGMIRKVALYSGVLSAARISAHFTLM